MRKRYRVLLLAAIVAAVVVPVSFAWSIDSSGNQSAVGHLPAAAVASTAAATVTSSVVIAAPPLSHTAHQARRGGVPVPDAAKLLLVGSILFGLAAFVRKAI